MPDKIKSLNLGLALLTVVGEDVLETAVKGLSTDLQDSTAELLLDVAKVMQPVSFELAARMVPPYCYALWPKPISQEEQDKLAARAVALQSLRDVPAGYKALLLGIWLARITDGATLRKAVDDLGASIRNADAASIPTTEPAPPTPAPQPKTLVGSAQRLQPALGILAYGSLIDCPGPEISDATESVLSNEIMTPFAVEFARSRPQTRRRADVGSGRGRRREGPCAYFRAKILDIGRGSQEPPLAPRDWSGRKRSSVLSRPPAGAE
jgi:hypothetical protein